MSTILEALKKLEEEILKGKKADKKGLDEPVDDDPKDKDVKKKDGDEDFIELSKQLFPSKKE